jgi:c-di-GMP-binding flagellar brake protein YcgR
MTYPEEHIGSIEARRFPRYEIDTEIHVATFGREKPEVMRGRTLSISEAGVAGLFVTGWDAGTAVNLKFFVPVVSNPVRVDAVVRSRSDHRYGFEFVELNPVQREIIDKTCRALALLQSST